MATDDALILADWIIPDQDQGEFDRLSARIALAGFLFARGEGDGVGPINDERITQLATELDRNETGPAGQGNPVGGV